MPGRKRNIHLHVMVTEDELAAIHGRMAEAGISNAGAYMRKMALNGYILHIDLAPVKELVSPYSGAVPTISIRWPSMPTPTGCTRRRSTAWNGTMKSCGARWRRCSGSSPSWWLSKTWAAGSLTGRPAAFSFLALRANVARGFVLTKKKCNCRI